MKKDEWLTPPAIIRSLGEFDLDPCSPVNRPWPTAAKHFTIHDNGLLLPWFGRVWMNPPYGREIVSWMNRMAMHDHGVAMVFARTETDWFFRYVWDVAESILFLKGRIQFHHVDGTQADDNGGAPSVLIAYGESNADALAESGLIGRHVYLKGGVFVIGMEKDRSTWKIIVGDALEELGGQSNLEDIYDRVMKLAPKRVNKNAHYREKVRQTLQKHFIRMSRGIYASA